MADRLLSSVIGRLAEDEQISIRDLRLLALLVERGRLTVSDAAPLLERDRAAASRAAAQLVSLGFAGREIDPDDRRIAWFSPTKKGLALHALVIKRLGQSHTQDTAA